MAKTFLQQVEEALDSAWVELEGWFQAEVPVVLRYTEDFIRDMAAIALKYVVAEAPKVLSGSEKFGNAVTGLVQEVEAQGKTVLVQDAQLMIQAAYDKFVSNGGQSSSVDSTMANGG